MLYMDEDRVEEIAREIIEKYIEAFNELSK